MSARPGGPVLGEIIANFRGAHRIIEIPSGMKITFTRLISIYRD